MSLLSQPVYMLSTKDNPYDPFTNYDLWFAYDENNGYHSCAFLDRVANTSDSMTDAEEHFEINRAIDEIITLDPTDMFIRVEKGNFHPPAFEQSKEGVGSREN